MTFEDLLAGEHHQVILLIIEKSPKSNFIVRKAAMLTVNQEYLPIRDEFEKALVESMKPSRMFIKQLAYDAGSDAVIPSFLLLDVGEEPLPMYIFGHRGNKKQIMTVYSAVKSMEENEEPCWYWDTRWDTHKWPELPPPRKPAGVSHVKH